jgi:hypothetical protein
MSNGKELWGAYGVRPGLPLQNTLSSMNTKLHSY